MPNAPATRAQIDRLEEIKDEMKALVREAIGLVRGTKEYERARAYWYGHIVSNLDDDHTYLGHQTTIQDTVEALREELECECEEEGSDGEA